MNDSAAQRSEFEFALSPQEMAEIIHNRTRIVDFNPESAYEALSPANKRALAHLVRAGMMIDRVFLKQDNIDNIRANALLRDWSAKGIEGAQDALTLFTMHNGIKGMDLYAQPTAPFPLFKDKNNAPGSNLYPPDITHQEIIDYVLAHPEQAAAILGSNTIVLRDTDRLVTLPYSVAFRPEMEATAAALFAAANETDHNGFANYLRWQAQALVNDSDPQAVYTAEKLWIGLEDSPLEFTISRESYKDAFTAGIIADPAVAHMIKCNGINPKLKDLLGVRIGIVNRESQQSIAKYRENMDAFRRIMPLNEIYEAGALAVCRPRLSMVNIDVVAFCGDLAAIRGGLTAASNLPNNDKLTYQCGEGSRLVFHRQVAYDTVKEHRRILSHLVNAEQLSLYDPDAAFLFLIGHELGHSLGPVKTRYGRDIAGTLGNAGNMLEESKADLVSLVMADHLASAGVISKEMLTKIYLTWVVKGLPSRKPADHEPHWIRQIMQINVFRESGAIQMDEEGKVSIIAEKMAPTARQMLTEVIGLQINGDPQAAEAYVRRCAAWNDGLQGIVDKRMKLAPRLYRLLNQPIRDRLLQHNL